MHLSEMNVQRCNIEHKVRACVFIQAYVHVLTFFLSLDFRACSFVRSLVCLYNLARFYLTCTTTKKRTEAEISPLNSHHSLVHCIELRQTKQKNDELVLVSLSLHFIRSLDDRADLNEIVQ